ERRGGRLCPGDGPLAARPGPRGDGLPPGEGSGVMRGCDRQWVEILSAWQDGEATEGEVVLARAHLEGCAGCRTARADFQRVHEAFGLLRLGAVPRLAPHVVLRPPAWSPGPRHPLAIAGALVAAMAVVLWSSQRHAAALAD